MSTVLTVFPFSFLEEGTLRPLSQGIPVFYVPNFRSDATIKTYCLLKVKIVMRDEPSIMAMMSKITSFTQRFLMLSGFVVWLGSCSNKNTQRPVAPFEPTLPFKPVKTADNTSHPGYALYVSKCYQCHQQAHPATLSVEKWRNTVPTMANHAGISQADGKKVLDYILHMKSQSVP